jgi:flagellar motor switch protein FliN/FliY
MSNPVTGKTATPARAQFNDLSAEARAALAASPGANPGVSNSGEVSLDLIMDVGVTVALEVGRARITVRELLQLTPGSIIELDRLANEPLDVLVNGVKVARGEVVVVNDRFGIRLTEVMPPAERMEQVK